MGLRGTRGSNPSRSATESCLCGFSARSGGIARACGFICVTRGTGEKQELHYAKPPRGHPRVNLQLRALAETEATVPDGEGRRLPVPGPPGSGTGRDSKEPIADMSAVESRENRDWRVTMTRKEAALLHSAGTA